MSPLSLKELKLEQYYRLVLQAAGEGVPFVVCDEHGVPHWPENSAPVASLERILAMVNNSPEGWRGGPDAVHHRTSDGTMLVYRALGGNLTGTIGYAAVLASRGGEEPHPTLLRRIEQVLADVGSCIEAEYLLTEELTEMADELAHRYEELNLVYSLEDQVRDYDPEQGLGVLRQLVEDCGEYLDVSAVGLFLPDEGVEETHVNDAEPNWVPDSRALWADVKHHLTDRLRARRGSIVINDRSDPERARCRIEAPVKLVAVPVADARGNVCGVLSVAVRDDRPDFTNSDRKLLEVLAQQVAMVIQARYDPLTGLLNRRGFDLRLQETEAAARRDGLPYALLLLNLDQFKVVNDTCGQTAGDELLRQVAGLIGAGIRDSDVSGRIGGDEFAVLLDRCSPEQAMQVAGKLTAAVTAHRFSWSAKIFDVSCSVGVVVRRGEAAADADILGTAHSACLMAKQEGRGRVHLYDPDDAAFAAHRGQLEWMPRLRQALEQDRFVLFAQPIVPIADSGNAWHFEILLRLRDETGDLVPPFAFIPAAERFRLMPDIDRWVVRHSLGRLAAWHADRAGPGFGCAINLSGQSISDEGFLDYIVEEQRRSGVPADRVCFEITETAAISSFTAARQFIGRLRERGFRFSLDDFGSGLSSFSYLSNLPVDYLKIDGELVKDIIESPVKTVMVESINKIGHAMGIRTIAEFVENEAILAKLGALGVDFAQGYHLGRPAELEEAFAARPAVRSPRSALAG